MPYNSMISRTDATQLIPVEVSDQIIKEVAAMNPIMSLARRLANMSRHEKSLPVANAVATAYFVNGDTGLKQTTELDWAGVTLTVEEVAAIVPIPENVLSDSEYDIWGETRPAIVEALSVAVANAVLWGIDIPATWTTALGAAGIFARATAAGHVVSNAAYADTYEAIMGESAAGADGLIMTMEADGFIPNGYLASVQMRGRIRNMRDLNGVPLFTNTPQAGTNYAFDGSPCYFPTDGTMNDATAWLIAGDWSKLVYSIRQDVTFKIITEGVISDAAGNIVFNLPQQDMVALRAVMRLGWALPNPINRMNATALTRCPFAALTA